MNPILPPPGGNPCDAPILGDLACNPIWAGPEGWFEKAITAAAQAVFGFAMSMLSWIWNLINDVTRPQTDGPFIYEWASRVFAISLPIIVAFLVFQVSMIVLRNRSAEGLGKAVAMAGVAVLGTSASVPVVHLLTTAVDALADDLTGITFGDLNSLGERFTRAVGSSAGVASEANLTVEQMAVLGAGSAMAGAFGFIIFGVFLVLGSIGVFGALIIRTMLLYVTIVMGPLAIMGLAWEKSRSWFKIWAGVVVTLIVSKLAIMIVFGLGVTVLETLSFEQDGAGIAGALLTGTLILLVAALMPMACFKFINFLGDEVQAGAMHGDARAGAERAGQAASRYGPSQIMQAKRSNGAGDSQGGGQGGSGRNGSGGRPARSTPTPAGGAQGTSGTNGAGGTNGASKAGGDRGGTSGGGGAAGSRSPTGAGAPAGGGGVTAAGGGGGRVATGGGGAAGGAAAAAGVAVASTVKAGRHAAQTAADQSEQTATTTGRTGPDMTRPSR